MMRDKSLGIWLIILFGISGVAVLLLAWLWPTFELERVTATFVGSAGLFAATIKALTLKRSPVMTDDGPTMRKVKAEDKS